LDQVRSFIAIELPAEFKAYLAEVQKRVSAGQRVSAKWVNPESIHLTLKFLGNVPAEKIDAIVGAVADSAATINPFSLQLAALGAFPNARRVEVVWAGLAGDLEPLQGLVSRLEDNLEALGFPPERRAFAPHLTLARVRPEASSLERQNLGQALSNFQVDRDLSLEVREISLMRSQLTRAGAIYSCLKSFALN
jgi:2'-5' RNA ligase